MFIFNIELCFDWMGFDCFLLLNCYKCIELEFCLGFSFVVGDLDIF